MNWRGVAYRPERVFTTTEVRPDLGEWTIEMMPPVHIIDPSILRRAYAHRGRRVVGRKIRQMRRRFRRAFG